MRDRIRFAYRTGAAGARGSRATDKPVCKALGSLLAIMAERDFELGANRRGDVETPD